MQLIKPPSCLKTFTGEALETMSPARESAHVGRQPWAFSSHPEISDFTASSCPETELRKVVGLTPVGSTRGSFLRLCLYHSVNNMIFHLKITRLKLFTIFIYVIFRKSFTYRHSYRNSVQEVKIVKRLSLPRVSYSSKN